MAAKFFPIYGKTLEIVRAKLMKLAFTLWPSDEPATFVEIRAAEIE